MQVLHRSMLTEAQRTVIRRGLAEAGRDTTHQRVSHGYVNISPKRVVRHTIERQLRGRFSGPPGIHKIEVDFAEPVMLSAEQHQILRDVVDAIAKANTPPGKVHWLSGTGQKPMLSQSDAAFLGKVPDPNAPMHGEPSWDPSVLYLETASRHATRDHGGAL